MTKRQVDLLRFFRDFPLAHGGVTPSYQEAADALGLKSKSGIRRLVGVLEQDGYLRKAPGRIRSVEIIRMPAGAE